jgi:hypothetical protein
MTMKTGVLAFCGVLALTACAPHGPKISEDVPVAQMEEYRPQQRSEGLCKRCNFEVYTGHRCGLTTPCALCGREKGARHLHEVVWTCPLDGTATARQHECNDSRGCSTCRSDKRSLLANRGCDRCYNQAALAKVQGITSYCQECNLEVGANHICAKTIFCRTCLREAGEGHVHDATRLCMTHEREHGADHECGTTVYCPKCHRDAGPNHKHGITEWCWRCNEELDWPHSHHR